MKKHFLIIFVILLLGLTACSTGFKDITVIDEKDEQFYTKEDRQNNTDRNNDGDKKGDKDDNDDIVENDTMEDDLITYLLVDLGYAMILEDEAITAYEEVTGINYTDDETTLEALKNEVIPIYTEFIDELYSIEVSNPRLNDLHALYISGAEKQLEAFHLFVDGIENQNPAKIVEGNELLDEGRELIDQYVESIESISLEYEIPIY
ncbi:hypothetical protein [Pallidibacillus pasinlerensis]|uniref:Lipoprotein n=1 Tax=Pallidibacillus pasinlerensis TaxID=2703818 RepID=A0ABX0A1P5_9BACI|nr:hypothetical protein [Pallidibacillus pasinlerensis]NCU16446.1 hypothetical protein [Pallidibacillus pasinlerensis]